MNIKKIFLSVLFTISLSFGADNVGGKIKFPFGKIKLP